MKHLAPIALFTTLMACTPVVLDSSRLDQLTRGQTFSVQREANPPYGDTTFLPGQRVIWSSYSVAEESCIAGTWSEPEPGLICFDYPDISATICWTFRESGGTITLNPQTAPDVVYTYTPRPDAQPCTP